MKIQTEKSFSASHLVQTADKDSPCRRLHGHTFRVIIAIEGPVDNTGMMIDFRHIKKVINKLDHRTLLPNRIVSRTLPTEETDHYYINTGYSEMILPKEDCILLPIRAVTAECLTYYLFKEIGKVFDNNPNHYYLKVKIYESEHSFAEYTGWI